MVTRRREEAATEPYKAGIDQAASGIVGISLDLSSIRGGDSRPELCTSVRFEHIPVQEAIKMRAFLFFFFFYLAFRTNIYVGR